MYRILNLLLMEIVTIEGLSTALSQSPFLICCTSILTRQCGCLFVDFHSFERKLPNGMSAARYEFFTPGLTHIRYLVAAPRAEVEPVYVAHTSSTRPVETVYVENNLCWTLSSHIPPQSQEITSFWSSKFMYCIWCHNDQQTCCILAWSHASVCLLNVFSFASMSLSRTSVDDKKTYMRQWPWNYRNSLVYRNSPLDAHIIATRWIAHLSVRRRDTV